MCRKRTRSICAAIIRKVESLVTVKCKDLDIDFQDKLIQSAELSLDDVMKIAVEDFDGEYIRLETVQQLIRNSKLLELFDNDGMIRRSSSAPSPIDCTIFVDNLPGNITEAYLRSAFKRCGDVLDVYFPYCKQSLYCKKRFAFVQFTSCEAVSKACRTEVKNEQSFNAKAENSANPKIHCPVAKAAAASEMQMQKFFLVKHQRKRRRRKCKVISKNCDLPKDWEIYSWKQWYDLKMIYRNIQLQNFFLFKWTLKGQKYIINQYQEQESTYKQEQDDRKKLRGKEKPSVEGADTGDQASVHLDTSIIKQTYENLRIRESSVSILRLLSYCKAEWLWYALGFLFLLLYSLCRIFIPYYTGKVIFDIIAWNSYETLMKSVMYMTLLSLASSIFAGFRAGCLEYGYVKVNLSIRRDLFCALLKQEVGFFDVNSTGVIMSRLSSDCQSMSDYVSLNLNIFLRNLVMLIGSLIVMANLSWRLTMMNFVAFPLIVLVSKVFGGRYENLSQNAQDSLANVCDVAEEVLSNIRTVKSFANEDGEVRRFQSKVQIITNIYKKKAIAVFGYTLLNELFSMIILVAVLWYGGHLVMVKKISSENLIPYLLYQLQLGEALIVRDGERMFIFIIIVLMLVSFVQSISGVYAGLRQAVGASKKVFELIDRKPEIVNAGKLTSANVRGLVEFRNVSFSYPSRPHQQVLTNVSFKLNPGEMVALVGPSGGGKSSCIALLEHFYEPSSGQVLLDGVPVQEYDHKFFHKKVSLVSQEPVLFARSIRENISYGLEADEVSTAEIIRSAEQANASHFITLFADSFNTNVGEKGIQLSGGQKQRLAIARSLVRCPTVLLLDEATSALDAESEFLVQQAIYRNLAGHTVLLIAHRLSTVEKADRIIVIDAGRIVQQGSHEQLLSEDGLYKNLIHRQLHGDEPKQ
ncbi:ATP-binding cassette sub-family B member 9 [Trichinella pseudospiralis]|uniref:ATP-binding cassette sub-family B member 9 n=1 Tax=Trichinella pseudospiralis TaxID=6337 RepID=A0A0V0XJ68_TRIPS|nr:ATP-binding cassette sub-family B member 9 [Trichinella pseudospiralis]